MRKQKLLPKHATGHDGERDLMLALEAPRARARLKEARCACSYPDLSLQ